jgi:large subunit ribosomal protein L17
MRHQNRKVHLGRTASHRKALRKGIVCSLFSCFGGRGYVVTTREKAKFCRGFAERLITLAKEDSVHRRRLAAARLGSQDVVRKLFAAIGPAYKDRPGGYTRIIKLGKRRVGDNGVQVLFGFVPPQGASEEAAETKTKAKAKATS